MKNYPVLLAIALLFTTTLTYSVGAHNGLISFGGTVMNYSHTELNSSNPTSKDYLGGGYHFELGYLYLKNQDKFVHGLDTRITAGNTINLLRNNSDSELDTMFLYIGTTYQFGFNIKSGRILLDMVGLNFGYLTSIIKTDTYNNNQKEKNIQFTGNSFIFGINLPLGMTYIMDNGFMIGFRHRIDMLFGESYKEGTPKITDNSITQTIDSGSYYGNKTSQWDYIGYNITINLGYVFGK